MDSQQLAANIITRINSFFNKETPDGAPESVLLKAVQGMLSDSLAPHLTISIEQAMVDVIESTIKEHGVVPGIVETAVDNVKNWLIDNWEDLELPTGSLDPEKLKQLIEDIISGLDIAGTPGKPGKDGQDCIIADALDYPVGWQQVTAWTDPVVTTSHGIWLKQDGRIIDLDKYPELTNSTAVLINIDQKIMPYMTGPNTPVPFVVSGISEYSSGTRPWMAFNGVPGTGTSNDFWQSSNIAFPHWIKVDLGTPTSIGRYEIKSRGFNDTNTIQFFPRDFELQGSNNDSEYYVIDKRTDVSVTGVLQTRPFVLSQEHKYRYYRLYITKNNGSSNYSAIGEIELYSPKYDRLLNISPVNGQFTYVKAKTISNDFNTNLKGDRGKNNYELWLEAGNEGSLDDFLESQKGQPGVTPQKGIDYFDGAPGLPGKDGALGLPGKSHFDLWLEAGHQGSIIDFLNWNKAEAGGFGNIGEVFYWPFEIPPGDAWFMDGSIHLIADSPELFKLFGTRFGGDGVTTFGIPDAAGEFIRGYDPTGKRDPQGKTRVIGKHQNATKEVQLGVNNTLGSPDIWRGGTTTSDYSSDYDSMDVSPANSANNTRVTLNKYSSSSATPTWYTARPTNINLMPCIRYKRQEAITVAGILAKVEYASNDDMTTTWDARSGAVNREIGSQGININLTAHLYKSIVWPTPYNPLTDIAELQISPNRIYWCSFEDVQWASNSKWIDAYTRFSGDVDTSGFGLTLGDGTVPAGVMFGRYMTKDSNTGWSVASPWYWRVVKKTFATNPVPLVMSPHLWQPGKEYMFEDASYGQRFVGTITAAANEMKATWLANLSNFRIIDQGGWYQDLAGASDWHAFIGQHYNHSPTTLFSYLEARTGYINFSSKSSVARTNSPYDIWIRYLKL